MINKFNAEHVLSLLTSYRVYPPQESTVNTVLYSVLVVVSCEEWVPHHIPPQHVWNWATVITTLKSPVCSNVDYGYTCPRHQKYHTMPLETILFIKLGGLNWGASVNRRTRKRSLCRCEHRGRALIEPPPRIEAAPGLSLAGHAPAAVAFELQTHRPESVTRKTKPLGMHASHVIRPAELELSARMRRELRFRCRVKQHRLTVHLRVLLGCNWCRKLCFGFGGLGV